MKTGIYINLDRSKDRKKSLLDQITLSGLDPKKYERFSAIEPKDYEKEKLRGLKSRGEVGLWQSFLFTLQHIADNPTFDSFVHLLEDDSEFSPNIISAIEISRNNMANNSDIDIIFLDYFFTVELAKQLLEIKENYKEDFVIFPARQCYLACTSSFLIRKSSASFIYEVLKRIFYSECKLRPIDLTLRSLFQLGIINGSLLYPPPTSPKYNPPISEKSTIQTNVDESMSKSLEAHILLRKLASFQFSPFYCGESLSNLFNLKNPLNANSSHKEFLEVFSSCQQIRKDF